MNELRERERESERERERNGLFIRVWGLGFQL
jgi:hypothetical protein